MFTENATKIWEFCNSKKSFECKDLETIKTELDEQKQKMAADKKSHEMKENMAAKKIIELKMI